jgi:hypothetical protein
VNTTVDELGFEVAIALKRENSPRGMLAVMDRAEDADIGAMLERLRAELERVRGMLEEERRKHETIRE